MATLAGVHRRAVRCVRAQRRPLRHARHPAGDLTTPREDRLGLALFCFVDHHSIRFNRVGVNLWRAIFHLRIVPILFIQFAVRNADGQGTFLFVCVLDWSS